MAWFPCSRGPHKNLKRNSHAYFGLTSAGDTTRWHLRLCDVHFAQVEEHLAKFEVDPECMTIGIDGTADTCLACLKPVDEGAWQFFATCYPSHEQRKDYWARLHVDCRLPQPVAPI